MTSSGFFFISVTFLLITALLLSGCATPITTMSKNGQIVTCGGHVGASIAGGVVGYHIQKNADKKCVENLKKNGFK